MDNFPIDEVYKILKAYVKALPVPVIELVQEQTKDPFKVLVATILSARTKDETTTQVVKKVITRLEKCL